MVDIGKPNLLDYFWGGSLPNKVPHVSQVLGRGASAEANRDG